MRSKPGLRDGPGDPVENMTRVPVDPVPSLVPPAPLKIIPTPPRRKVQFFIRLYYYPLPARRIFLRRGALFDLRNFAAK